MDGSGAIARPPISGERSFKKEIESLLLKDGEVFHGEGILAVTKALLQSGVSYVGGYPGAPMSHLIDVLAEASEEILKPMGIQFEQSASEAGAAALLGASINYPLRGAVTWKSIVGTNVASDALSNLASSGVIGGALIILGDDYGEGSSIIQERTHAFALKSTIPLIEPRHDLATIVDMTEHAFQMSEASNLPVFMSLRIRACHLTGDFVAKDNRKPKYNVNDPLPESSYKVGRIVLPPETYIQEKAKLDQRMPAVERYIVDNNLNELFPGKVGDRIGIITQGGSYALVARALRRLKAADAFGASDVSILCLNVVHPLVPDQIIDYLKDKDSVLVVEEGNPAYLESRIAEIVQRKGFACRIHGKDVLPMAGEYVADVVRDGVAKYLIEEATGDIQVNAEACNGEINAATAKAKACMPEAMPPRAPSFCTGCPERPVMAALKILMKERGRFHIAMDIGCSSFGSLAPFNVGNSILGYGLSLASGGMVGPALGQPTVALMGDGAFWHNGLTSGIANAKWNNYDTVLIIVDNGYAAATGQQHVPSTGTTPTGVASLVTIEKALRGLGIDQITFIDSYSLDDALDVIRDALDDPKKGMRVIISNNECMLARQRRERPAKAKLLKLGKTVVKEKFGVDEEVCTGDHSCMRLNGCPSLTLKQTDDPLKETPVAFVDEDCVACGHCGEVAHAAQLCPSFYKAEGIQNPGPIRRVASAINRSLLGMMGAA